MTEQTPEIVAAAELSPLSPRPLHTFTSSPISVPALQDQADNLDVASLDNLASANHFPIMAATHDADDTIVVAGSDESDASIADDDSFDAYGEDDDTQQQGNEQGASNDDYANTFDSPPAQEADADQAASAAANTAPDSLSLAQPSETLPNQASAALTSGDASPANPSSAQSATPSPPQPTEIAKPTADSQPDPVSRAANPNLPSQTAQPGPGSDEDSSSVPIDIEKLVDDLAAKAAAAPAPEPAHSSDEPSSAVLSQPPSSAPGPPQPSSLPPKPTMTQDAAHLNALPSSFHPSSTGGNPGYGASSASTGTASHAPFHVSSGQTSAHATPGAPGTSNDAVHTLPPPPSANFPGTPGSASYPQAQAYSNPAALPSQDPQPQDGQQSFDDFVADERRYMAEAKWERFPEGSRIFIGNLSQERVSKRDVFDLFHKYGRMAQISLKSAYGFVQYHSVADAQQAMEALQGIEVRGRKIHLEYSRTQKKDKDRDRDRDRSPDRSKNRGGARGTDRYDGRDKRGRDDWRATNDNAARRSSERFRDSRSSGYESFDRSRDRSRSPNRYGRRDNDSYRRRSPSPYGRSRHEGDGLDIPRRYGSDVPDVQLLLTQEVERGFVGWVERAFQDRGLKTDAMFLNPRFPRDTLIQRQVIEGVHAVVELNSRAQNFAKIPLQLFDRSAGTQNVRFDIYQDLDPPMAAELVLRARAGAPSNQPTYPPAPNAYGQSYAAPAQAFGQAYANPQGPPAPQGMPDLSGLVGHIDNATLQKVLAALQTSQAPGSGMSVPPPAYSPPGQQMAMPGAPAASTPQIDINALLGSIQSAAGGPSPPPGAGPYGYPGSGASSMMAPAGAGMNPNAPGAGADSAQAVQSIMAQLAKFK